MTTEQMNKAMEILTHSHAENCLQMWQPRKYHDRLYVSVNCFGGDEIKKLTDAGLLVMVYSSMTNDDCENLLEIHIL